MFNFFRIFSKPKVKSGVTSGSVSQGTIQAIQIEWTSINQMLQGGQPSQLRQALIAADKTLDNALRDCVAGVTMSERLKNARNKFDKPTLDTIWNAHKLRNTLVHESGIEVPHHTLRKSVEDLKKGLLALHVRV